MGGRMKRAALGIVYALNTKVSLIYKALSLQTADGSSDGGWMI